MSDWALAFFGWDAHDEMHREALCTLGNGYVATRGAAEWADADGEVHYPGTYLAGGYNRLTTEIQGHEVVNEDLVNFPNWLPLTFRVDGGRWLSLADVELLGYRQCLDMEKGVLLRCLRMRDAEGRETSLTSHRLVHMGDPHLAAISWELVAHDWSGRVEIRSALDGRVRNYGVARYRELANRHLDPIDSGQFGDDGLFLVVRTKQSRVEMAQAGRTRVYRGGAGVDAERSFAIEPDRVALTLALDVGRGETLHVEKLVAVYCSRDHGITEVGHEARHAAGRAPRYAELEESQQRAWHRLWRRADIAIDADGEVPEAAQAQLILRLHIFHLLVTASHHTRDLDVGVPARGWHGEAYRGHIFWDELFILPYLDFRIPEISEALLNYRHRRLDRARQLAAAAGFAGAMYPWQSGSNGVEETQVIHLNPRSGRWLPDASHRQRHVNLAIAYNVWNHYRITGSYEFLHNRGAQMILEIMRFWSSIAQFDERRGRFEIHGVMGPDEYHDAYPDADGPGLRNNAYTNVMVAWLAEVALDAYDRLLESRRRDLREAVGLDDAELTRWTDMVHKMFVPFHDGIISQFEGYEELEEFDWESYRRKYGDIHRLDRILEAEGDTTNRYKVSKQADVLMLSYLLSEDEFHRLLTRLGYAPAEDLMVRCYRYYSRRTAHGSTLSNVVHAAVSARYDAEESYRMFLRALDSDVRDIQGGTTREGVHLGAMASTVDIVQRFYTGLQIRDDRLVFDPVLPDRVTGVRFSFRFRRALLDVEIADGRLAIGARPGGDAEIEVQVRDRTHYLRDGHRIEVEL